MKQTGARHAIGTVLMLVCLALVACSKDEDGRPPAPSTDVPAGAITITGDERIGWDQRLASSARIEDYAFAAYIDGIKHALNASCEAGGSPGTYTCAAPLPFMALGQHTLRLGTIRVEGAAQIESERSAPLTLVKVASALTNRVEREDSLPGAVVEAVAGGLGPISDLAVDPSGRVFVAEREGRVRILENDRLRADPALVLPDVAYVGGLGLFALALPPDFEQTRHVYVAYTARSPEGPVYKLLRSREVNGQLGETAVLLEELGAQEGGWMAIRFGPDGKLYAALAARRNTPSGSYLGKILRMNTNGTTPGDHSRATPVVGEVAGVRGLGWMPDGSALIATEVFSPAPLAPVAFSVRRSAGPALSLAGGQRTAWQGKERPAGLAFLESADSPDRGVQILAAMLDGGVQRFQLQGSRITPVGRRLLVRHGAVRAIATTPAGVVYAGTANGDAKLSAAEPAENEDLLLKVRLPVTARK